MTPETTEQQWVATDRSRHRARATALRRHPFLATQSRFRRRRGVRADRPTPVGTDEVLERLVEMPVSVWTYGFDHPSVRHMGPMAQDFAAAFGLGSDDRRIDMVDAAGVLIASVQALHRRVAKLEDEVERLRSDRAGEAGL